MLSIFQSMDQFPSPSSSSTPYNLLFNALFLIPIWHYLLGFFLVTTAFLYNFLGFHFFQEFLFGGTPITLTYNPSSPIYSNILSKCKILHSRYFATPWLSSPHIQTFFLHFFGRPPALSYRRQLFRLSDGGTIALDWLMNHDVFGDNFHVDSPIPKDDSTPIVVVIPGLTSDSDSAYIKHIAFKVAKRGWNVVVCNHRGLGGISITSDCFYNAGWTEDLRVIINWLHDEYPNAPLFTIGTSIGSNVLVKYLGEDGERTPVAGGAAICNPWDLVIADRFICRRLLQKLYDRALTVGLQGYAQLHEPRYSRLANWEGIMKSRSIREFDHHATCLVGKFETVDAYYRHCSSSPYVQNVAVPLLCISALDDPVCTREAIPWDECRANENVLLATTQHGGHLAFFEGLTASSVWWVRAVDEFLGVLHCSTYMHAQKKQASPLASPVGPSIDQGPYVNVAEDGMLVAVGEQEEHFTRSNSDSVSETAQTSEQGSNVQKIKSSEQEMNGQDVKPRDGTGHIRRCLSLIAQKRGRSIWLLAFIAIFTSWPLVGSVLSIAFRKKLKRVLPAAL